MSIGILDELERIKDVDDLAKSQFVEEAGDYVTCYTPEVELLIKALPALIRVARAAEAFKEADVFVFPEGQDAVRYYSAKKELEEALQQLRDLSRDIGLVELVALQQEMGLDD